ncbi:hypothetical protein AB1Y20_023645 [Prymnesium parvum]|uniref:Transmembrane 9 superfamily member n=1 Tax=Prymnesium parvum TaxID=97485 RepID=A0AB34JEW4_PRYPA
MLRTGKQVWEANAKRTALDFRMQELEFHVSRFTTLATQASVLAGFAFEGLVHMEVPKEWEDSDAELIFWLAGSLCMMFALYVLIIASIACILGHQLALFGAEGKSLEDAVTVLRNRRCPIFIASMLSLLSLVVASAAMAYIKMGIAGPPVAVSFAVFCIWTFFSLTTLVCNLGNRQLVTGGTQIYTGRGYFDLANISPGHNGHVPLNETV